MDRINRLFLLLVVIGPFHMIEQMLTSIDEFYWLRNQLDAYYAWFAPASADLATVILITVVWTKISVLIYALLVSSTARLVIPAAFGLFGVSEAHHLIEAMVKSAYDPGVVTAIPYAIAGGLLVREIWRDFRRSASQPRLAALA